MPDSVVIPMTATFPLVRQAAEFVERYLTDGKSRSSNVVRTLRMVTWDATVTATEYEPLPEAKWQYVQCLTENAGYIGSTQSRKAIVNGRIAPVCY